jgi:hypothetical protein
MNQQISSNELVMGQPYRCYAKSNAGNSDTVNVFVGYSDTKEPMFTNDIFKGKFILNPNIWTFYRV